MPGGNFRQLQLEDSHGSIRDPFCFTRSIAHLSARQKLSRFPDRLEGFSQGDTAFLGVSFDSHYAHLAWRNSPRSDGGIGEIAYPLLSDLTKNRANSYEVMLPDGVAFCGLFLLDLKGIVRHQVINGLHLGRSVNEAVRMVDALHFHEAHGKVGPANWHQRGRPSRRLPTRVASFFSDQFADIASSLLNDLSIMTDLAKWTLLLHVAVTLAMVGLIWFVQIVHYPLLSKVGREHFRRYELDYQRLATWIVAPGMLTELLTAVFLLWFRPDGLSPMILWLGLGLLATIWLVTYTIQVPQHATLVLAYDEDVQRRLVRGNWVRTGAWSARGFLVLWMVAQVISNLSADPGGATLAGT